MIMRLQNNPPLCQRNANASPTWITRRYAVKLNIDREIALRDAVADVGISRRCFQRDDLMIKLAPHGRRRAECLIRHRIWRHVGIAFIRPMIGSGVDSQRDGNRARRQAQPMIIGEPGYSMAYQPDTSAEASRDVGAAHLSGVMVIVCWQ